MTRRTTFMAFSDGQKIRITKQHHSKLADSGKEYVRSFTLDKKLSLEEI